jgi:hypothetical protein
MLKNGLHWVTANHGQPDASDLRQPLSVVLNCAQLYSKVRASTSPAIVRWIHPGLLFPAREASGNVATHVVDMVPSVMMRDCTIIK